ncbi:hypothetical protein BV898_16055 [Hypsibius exemplaris]|uniref:Uncharacterized protein n=1 Tax=Hypsibius exemplaris TaxID=2072580 RepID=A0A9X6NCT7_HYPEX|nr:hypothetical protein BV898_16055 [Hypsibius exemplaris]
METAFEDDVQLEFNATVGTGNNGSDDYPYYSDPNDAFLGSVFLFSVSLLEALISIIGLGGNILVSVNRDARSDAWLARDSLVQSFKFISKDFTL